MNNNHKYFLQFILKNKYIPIERALKYCDNFQDGDENIKSTTDLKKFIDHINHNILKQALKISIAKCEVTGDVSVILISTASDDISKLQNSYSAIELEYFQAILKELITTDNHQVSIMSCFNLGNSLTASIRKDNVETLLEKWANEGYFVKSDSDVYLGPRCIMEFASYLSAHCKDYFQLCNLCSEAVFIGRICGNCSKLMHKHCIEKYLRKQEKCPHCKKPWEDAQQNQTTADDTNTEDSDE